LASAHADRSSSSARFAYCSVCLDGVQVNSAARQPRNASRVRARRSRRALVQSAPTTPRKTRLATSCRQPIPSSHGRREVAAARLSGANGTTSLLTNEDCGRSVACEGTDQLTQSHDPPACVLRPPPRRLPVGILVLVLASAFSFGAIVRAAMAVHFHTTACGTGHGMVHGTSATDGKFHARITRSRR
jgi:hypothetical protein